MAGAVPNAREMQFHRFLAALRERGELERAPDTFDTVLGKLLRLQTRGERLKRARRATPDQTHSGAA
jgi:hypothetical protein